MDGNRIWCEITRALRRVLRSDFQQEHATDVERRQLEVAKEPVTNPLAQDYAAWRRSLLWIAGIALTLLALLEAATFTSMADLLEGSDLGNAVGEDNLETIDGIFGFLIVPVLVGGILSLVAAANWTNVRFSRRMARLGFLIMFLTPFVMAALPAKEMLDFDHLREDTRPLAEMGLGTIVGLRLFFLIGPRAIALFPGVIRSSMALKTLVPESPLPGWASTFVAPLYSIFLLVVFALVNQIQGNFLLVLALTCLMVSPLIYLWQGREILRPQREDEVSDVVGRLRRRSGMLTSLGVLFFGIFFIDIEMSFGDILKFVISIIGNVVLLTVVAADLLLALLHHGHAQSKALVESKLEDSLEERFAALEGVGFTDLSTKDKELHVGS